MLNLRNEQLSALREACEVRFVRRLIEHLRADHGVRPDLVPDALLHKMVDVGVARARGHGFRSDADVARFVGLMFAVAPNFDEQPTLRAWLDDPLMPPEERIEAMLRSTTELDWQQARQKSDARAWGL